ncbi:MAG: transposase domain-containing protein [Pseudomonadota bacterium]|nr:transposase domain-containing protein [Pseudomonadota bacterium]
MYPYWDTFGGAVASANLFSIVEKAKANGLERHAYLSLLAQLSYAQAVEDFETLLPWNAKTALAPISSRSIVSRQNAVA